jgi:hypothetical protein
MGIFYKIISVKILTTYKNWQQWQIQEYDDAGVAETKVKDLL